MSETFLSQEEVDALLAGVAPDTPDSARLLDGGAARPYNLATQERIVRGRMPTLELINERFARTLRVSLYNFIRRAIEVTAGTVKVIKYSDFVRNLPVPTSLNLIHIKPLRGSGLIVIDPNIVFAIIDNLFGGSGKFHTRVEGREFSQTELRIVRKVLEHIFENYTSAWEPVHPIKLEYVRSEINTQFVNIATPNEVVVSTAFTIELGPVSGTMFVCFPYSMIEPIRDHLSSALQGEALEHDHRWRALLTHQIKTAEVEMVANLATARSSVGALLQLKVGDIIPLNIPEQLDVTVDSVPVLACSYGQVNGHYALKVHELRSIHAIDQPSEEQEDVRPAE